MTWICPQCSEELGEYNGYCEYCKQENGQLVYNPDRYYIRDIRIHYIISERAERAKMTPQEELFSELFNHEKILVKDMDMLVLRAHREELSKIAFEARARLTAVDDEENDRKKKRQGDGVKGFERSLNTDEATTNAINTLKDKQKRLTKSEKIREGLIKLGIDPDAADKIMSAKNILTQVQTPKVQNHAIPETELNKEYTPVFNPFEKKQ
jgi:hypothetical protein